MTIEPDPEATHVTAHRKAMELCESAGMQERLGQFGDGREKLKEALQLETQAAYSCPAHIEPTRSVLFRSAATIAKQLGEIVQARRLVLAGLAGNPPSEICTELLEVMHDGNTRLVAARLVYALDDFLESRHNDGVSSTATRVGLINALDHALLLLK